MKMPPLFISFTACRRCQNISLLLFFQLRTPKRLRAAFLLGLSPAMSLTMFFLDACTWRRKKQLKCINSATTCGYNFFSEHEILLKLIFYSFMITDSNLTVWFNRGNICYQIQWKNNTKLKLQSCQKSLAKQRSQGLIRRFQKRCFELLHKRVALLPPAGERRFVFNLNHKSRFLIGTWICPSPAF